MGGHTGPRAAPRGAAQPPDCTTKGKWKPSQATPVPGRGRGPSPRARKAGRRPARAGVGVRGPWALLLPGPVGKLLGSLGMSWFTQPREKGDSPATSNSATGLVTVKEVRLAKLIHYHFSKSEARRAIWDLPTLPPHSGNSPPSLAGMPHPGLLAPCPPSLAGTPHPGLLAPPAPR